ncbi:MAG TPA: TRAP transporter large permease subunit [Myxococcales bacterium]|nr:TRAP transporter large permease subunit [Myxococcales bacterium]
MDWQIGFTLAVVVIALGLLVWEVASPDLVLMAALISLGITGILTPRETFSGFSNPAVAMVGVLFMLSAAVRETGALDLTVGRLLASARSVRQGIGRIVLPVAALSGFLNNSPIVAMMTPSVIDWARRSRLSASHFLIPLSYASILGSTLTLIGTSTNLVVDGLVRDSGMVPLGFFELFPVGLPIVAVGSVYLIFIAPHLLPNRPLPTDTLGERRREYVTTMVVKTGCALVGSSVEEAGLRHLPGLFLVEIERNRRVITPVRPEVVIEAEDRLVFAGVVATIVDLQKIRGLVPLSEEELEEQDAPTRTHGLVEAVVSSSSPLIGRSIRESNFRSAYDAAVIAVHRNAERVPGKIGEIVLQPGDTLLMQSSPDFMQHNRNSPDFYLASELSGSEKPRFNRAGVALTVVVAMVLAVSTGVLPITLAGFVAVGIMLATRCVSPKKARESVPWSILVVIAAGLGIAQAMAKTGAAEWIAQSVFGVAHGLGPLGALIIIYCLCMLMAELLHHTAAVAIMFPIAVALAGQVGADPRPFVIAIAIGSTCCFASPFAYQTHLIVYGAGNYRFKDFVRVGLPLNLICAGVALYTIPRIWSF